MSYKITVSFVLDDAPGKMGAAAKVRAAFLSSAVILKDVVISEIEFVEDHSDAQLSLEIESSEVDEDSNLCSFCGHVTHADDEQCSGCSELTDLGEMRARRDAAVRTEVVV